MNHSRKRVLDLLSKGAISSDEAERLLEQLDGHETERRPDEGSVAGMDRNGEPNYLCIKTEPKGEAAETEEPVEIRIPLVLVRAGMKLGWLIPESKREILSDSLDNHGIGIDLNSLDKSSLAEFVGALSKNPININTKYENVRIYCG